MRKILILTLLLVSMGCGKNKSKEQIEVEQAKHEPVLICTKNGVRLYKVYDGTSGGSSYVYFTVPEGNTHWTTTDDEGNVHHHQVTGGPKR